MIVTIQLRRDTAADWTAKNDILHQGELGIELDTSRAKIGDGVTPWNSLGYWSPGTDVDNFLLITGGTLTGWLAPSVVTLIDAPVTAINAASGNDFRWTLGGNHTLAIPSTPVDGQVITIDIRQPASGGPYTPAFTGGAGGFAFGADGLPSWSTAANAVDVIGFRYHGGLGKWLCQGWKLGYS